MGMKAKKSETVEVELPAEAVVPSPEKKKKKSKKTTEEPAAEAEAEETVATEEPEKKKKKKKKAEAEEATEEVAEAEEEPKKKKSKKNKDAEETEKVEEEPAAEEGEKKKKKKRKTSEEAEEEPEAKKAKTEEEGESEAKEEAEPKEEEKKEEPTESLTVFIGGLPYEATEEAVKKDFEECGEIVSFRFLKDFEGNPKGVCFCQYANKEGVDKALEFNETDYGGRTLRVRIAEDSPPGGKGDKGKGKKGKGKKGAREMCEKPEDCKSLVVKNLSYDTTEDAIWTLFEGVQNIERVKLLTDRETGQSKGIAFVDFASTEDLDNCVKEKQNAEVDGRNVFLDYSGGAKKGDGKKGDGKKGKGKGKGKKGGKKGGDSGFAQRNGSIQESTGVTKSFDSDSD